LLLLLAGCGVRPGQSFKQLSYPMPVSHLTLDGIDLAFTDVGQGDRTLLLVHGLGSYMPVWSRNLDALARNARVVAIDLPGYGKSGKANYAYSMAFYARVVDRVIDALHLQHVVLVGHSMGGQIAMTHALRFPGSWLAEAVDKDFVAKTAPEAVYNNLAGNFWNMPPAARFMVDDRLRIVGGPEFDAYAYAVARSVYAMVHEPVADRLPEIKVPVLVIFGAEDGLIPNPVLHGGTTRAVAEAGVQRLRFGRLVLIPHAGHMVQFERPAEVDAAVLDFLKEVP
jgi:pimeloyl-ACP methyl ester carboxylesterase